MIMPKEIRFKTLKQIIDGKSYTTYAVADYPVEVPNAWGRAFFSVPGSRITCKFRAIPQHEAERRLDRSIMEMESQLQKRYRASVELEKTTQLETIRELMIQVKQGGEVLFDTCIFCTVEDMYLSNVDRADNGGFPVGARLPLRLFNVQDAKEIRWTFNGTPVSVGPGCYYIVERKGTLRAHIIWEDGSEEVVMKEINIEELNDE